MGRDYSNLSARIHTLDQTVTCDCKGVTLRLHFPSFRQGLSTVHELIESIVLYLAPFCLPRSEVAAVRQLYGQIPVEAFELKMSQLLESARALFKRANEVTNRNGEAGELLLYLLTEWILDAPQLIAKMSLKTNKNMPVHGADGVHIKYSKEEKRILLYWGESKLYTDVGQAISQAIKSISESLEPENMKHEIDLVQRNINFTGLDESSKQEILRYLDPFDDFYNERHDITTCLIGFDFDAYTKINPTEATTAESQFVTLAKTEIGKLAPKTAAAIKAAHLDGRPIEIFFFPVPSVQQLRDYFQTKIGWKP